MFNDRIFVRLGLTWVVASGGLSLILLLWMFGLSSTPLERAISLAVWMITWAVIMLSGIAFLSKRLQETSPR